MNQLPAARYIRIFSDLHLDFDVRKNFKPKDLWRPEILETDKESILLIAGDLWHAHKYLSFANYSWLAQMASQFQYIVFILGNHDLWNGNLTFEYKRVREMIAEQKLENVFFLQNSSVIIGEHKFVGATLWTDFLNRNKECLYKAREIMNDYKHIKYSAAYIKLNPFHILQEHVTSRNYIFENAKRDYPEQKVWVISHHLPSYHSIHDMYKSLKNYYDNGLYYSDLDADIEKSDIDFWVHGHSHHFQNYMIGDTEIIANPRGYPNEDSEYNPWHRLEL